MNKTMTFKYFFNNYISPLSIWTLGGNVYYEGYTSLLNYLTLLYKHLCYMRHSLSFTEQHLLGEYVRIFNEVNRAVFEDRWDESKDNRLNSLEAINDLRKKELGY